MREQLAQMPPKVTATSINKAKPETKKRKLHDERGDGGIRFEGGKPVPPHLFTIRASSRR
jgi:hypothetical protein